jgi:hypothetical protein
METRFLEQLGEMKRTLVVSSGFVGCFSRQLNDLFIGSNSTSLIGRYRNHKSKEWFLVSTILSCAWK